MTMTMTMTRGARMTRGVAQMAMDKTSNARIPLAMVGERISRGEAFMSGSMRGSVGPDGRYTVWSYHEPIAGRTAAGDWWVSGARFSKTTTRHQDATRRALEAVGIAAVTL